MGGRNKKKFDEGFCLFGAETLQKLMGDLTAEADGVRESDDIEYIHRMRVASRRIRAALPIFACCFSGKDYNRFRIGVRSITRSLGAARDLDVQIEYIRSYLDSLPVERPPVWHAGFLPPTDDVMVLHESGSVPDEMALIVTEKKTLTSRITLLVRRLRSYLTGEVTPPVKQDTEVTGPFIRSGIECLLLRWTGQRDALHPDVVKAVDEFETSGIGDELLIWCREQIVSARLHGTDIHSRYAFETAYHAISMNMEFLFSFERYITDPERISEHHQMRIAAKQLRYTMEIFRDLYPDRLKNPISMVKQLQDILGDMHDCDVWLDVLPAFLQEEEARVTSFFGHSGFMRFIRPGILHLASERRIKRNELYRSFVGYWSEMNEGGVWDEIKKTIIEPLVIGSGATSPENTQKPERIAFIADIHANLPALDAVLADARQRGVTQILHLGDLVGFGPFPEATVRRIREDGITGICGNIDTETLMMKKKDCRKMAKKSEKEIALCWTKKQLSKESQQYLSSLPREIRAAILGRTFLLTHGSPTSTTGRISSGTPDTELSGYASSTGADSIVSGHTHLPFTRTVGGCLFINPGSVGRPFDRDPRACYCIVNLDPLSVCHIRVPYDIEAVVGALLEADLPGIFSVMITNGLSLEEARFHSEENNSVKSGDGVSAQCTFEPSITIFEPR